MKAVSRLLLGCVLALFAGAGSGRCADPATDKIADKLEKAKAAYAVDMKKAVATAKKHFGEQEKKAREKGDKKLIDQLKEEWKAFEELGTIPESAPASFQKTIVAHKAAIEAAYTTAAKEYSLANRGDLATEVEREWEIRSRKGVIAEPNLARYVKAAGVLRPHANLTLQMAFGVTVSLKKGDPLPDQPFVITEITFDQDVPLPWPFVNDVLLPSLAETPSVTHLWGYPALALTEDQLTHLAELPVAKTMTGFGAKFELSARSAETLKQFSNLSALCCSATLADDAMLANVGKFSHLRNLQLHKLGRFGSLTPKGLQSLTALPLTNLELRDSSAPGREFIRTLPSMRDLRAVNFYGTPVSDEDLMELARCPHLHRIVVGGSRETVSDEGIFHLLKCPALHDVQLASTLVTDGGLKQIAKIRALQIVGLQKTKVTAAGVEELAAARPDLTIVLDDKTITPKKK
ncbi:hypothetical protein [Fimbriiglobus ruber]|uniref:Alanyl-tRNA synthetase n=1 Tax=Fimbriiglobus ruber TaxID=1908690 RepID=A0A225D3P8_9BACT|nr:hypothetical protein [Fimbriiglobus ruber]OWK35583.1 Alanyl-tRNA synthetase [Fimbriiglobus ruber]